MKEDFFRHIAHIPHQSRFYAVGNQIVIAEDFVSSLYLVKSGLVHLTRIQEDGRSIVLQRADSGSILAEASVFFETYHCTANVIYDSEMLVFPMSKIKQLFITDPNAAQAFAAHLANEVRNVRRRAEILALNKVSDRLSAWLAWNHGVLPDKGAWHHVADEIGISKEALYRELSKRRKSGEQI